MIIWYTINIVSNEMKWYCSELIRLFMACFGWDLRGNKRSGKRSTMCTVFVLIPGEAPALIQVVGPGAEKFGCERGQ